MEYRLINKLPPVSDCSFFFKLTGFRNCIVENGVSREEYMRNYLIRESLETNHVIDVWHGLYWKAAAVK